MIVAYTVVATWINTDKLPTFSTEPAIGSWNMYVAKKTTYPAERAFVNNRYHLVKLESRGLQTRLHLVFADSVWRNRQALV